MQFQIFSLKLSFISVCRKKKKEGKRRKNKDFPVECPGDSLVECLGDSLVGCLGDSPEGCQGDSPEGCLEDSKVAHLGEVVSLGEVIMFFPDSIKWIFGS